MRINPGRLDFASIQLVLHCAETGSLSAASSRSHFSVSAGSQRLSAIESALGRRLFVRHGRGISLTGAGERFVQHAQAIVNHLRLIEEQVATA